MDEFDYTDDSALALEESFSAHCDTLEECQEAEGAMDTLHEDMEDYEDEDLFDILERGHFQ